MDAWLATLEREAIRLHDDSLRGFVRFLAAVSPVYREPDGQSRIAVYQRAAMRYDQANDRRFHAVCLHYIGQENFVLGNHKEAFAYALQSQQLFREVGFAHVPEIGKYLHDLALNYYYFRDYEKVRDLMNESLKFRAYSQNLDLQRYNTLALCFEQLDMPDSAAYFFKKTIDRATFYRDSTWIALASGNLGANYVKRGQPMRGLPLLHLDYSHNRHNQEFPEMARNAALAIADVWLSLGDTDSVRFYLRESERIQAEETANNRFARQQRGEKFLRKYYGVLHRYQARLGNFREAYRYLDSLTTVATVLDGRYNAMVAELAEERLEIVRHVSEIALERERRRIASTRWLLAVCVMASVVVILALWVHLHRSKAARQRAVAALNEARLLAEKERAEGAFRQAKAELGLQLEMLEEKNALMEQLESEVEQLRHQLDTSPEVFDRTVSKLSEVRLLTNRDWHDFRRKFNALFDASLDRLKAANPNITEAEERIYALTQLGVDTKQMAAVLGISPESVRKARYRLKKRLETDS